MALESATYISGLVATNPVNATDPVSQGDDHLRLIKSTILNSFPGITGAVTSTHTELNYLDGVTGVSGTGNLVLSASPTITGTANIAALSLTTDLAVTHGGTGASTAADARTNLGLAIGTDVQAYDADLAAIAALAKTDGNIIVGNGSAWVAESGATARTSLGLGTGNSPTFAGATLGSAVLTGPSADRLEVGGRVAFIHDNTSYTSAEIFFSTSAPTTEGNSGDIYFEYTA